MEGHAVRRKSLRLIALAAFTAAFVVIVTSALVSLHPRSSPKKNLVFGLDYGGTLDSMSPSALDSALDDAVTLGTRWIRIDVAWSYVQPDGPTGYRWAGLDRVIQAARARGLDVLGTLGYAPAWAWPAGCGSPACRPADPAAFAAFAGAAALRYAPRGVHTWEIWNEPNITGFWKPAPDPAAYTVLLADTSRALRRADPASFLLLGGLAAVPTEAGDISQTDFLAGVCGLGGNHLVDAVSYHPYNFPSLYTAKTKTGTPWERIDSYQVNLVAVLTAYGTPTLPVWVTETGATTKGPGRPYDGTGSTAEAYVTEQWQARLAADAVDAAIANPHVGALFWYDDHDNAAANDYFGLRRPDGSAKPAFDALRQAVAAASR
jgi:hypothetical protein